MLIRNAIEANKGAIQAIWNVNQANLSVQGDFHMKRSGVLGKKLELNP